MKLIYGRAGSGKSEYVFNEVSKRLEKYENNSLENESNKLGNPEIKNEKIFIITPEQFSYTAEKRLLEKIEEINSIEANFKTDEKNTNNKSNTLIECSLDLTKSENNNFNETIKKRSYCSATTNVEVISFERMAYRVIKELFTGNKINLEKSSKAMIIFDAINKNKKDLKFLGGSLDNIDTILTQITEFKKHNISVKMLEEQVKNTKDEYLRAKLKDMLIMYKAMQDKLTDDFIDENDLLTILAENIEESHLFDNSIIYIDEFAGFTKQEFSVIEKLEKIAKELYITICTDELRTYKKPENDIFYDNKQTVQTLKKIADIDDEKQIKLENSYRFKNEELKHLEQNIFSVPYKVYNNETKNIKLYVAENQYEEIENISEKIFKLVRDDGYRYNDIAVICNNIDTYSSIIRAIFAEKDIPVFIDERKDITQNILIKYAISVLEIFSKNWTYESVFNYLKTGIVQIDDIFELENYCLKWGIKGSKFYKEKWNFEKENAKELFEEKAKISEEDEENSDNYEKISDEVEYNNLDIKESLKNKDINFIADQEKIVKPLLGLKEKLKGNMTAEDISKIIYEFYKNQIFDQNGQLNNIYEKCEYTSNSKYNENKNIDNQEEEDIEAWNLIVDALAEISNVFKNQKMNFDEYSKILKTAIQSKEIGQIPESQDTVIVGDVNRTKSHKVRAVFIIGANDGVFPSKISSEGFFNDKDREKLKQENFELAKGTVEKMYEENFNIYKALTTAEEKLYLSYSLSDTDSKTLRKSLIVSKLKRIFPKLIEETKNSKLEEKIEAEKNSKLISEESESNIKDKKAYENLEDTKISLGEDTQKYKLYTNLRDEILTKESTFLKLLENMDNSDWEEVFLWYKNNEPEKLESAIKGLSYTNLPKKIESKNIERIYGDNMRTSVSRLETYMSCPFSYYLKYGLKLSEKEKLEVKTVDTGSFIHEVIDEFFKRLMKNEEDIELQKNINDEKEIIDNNENSIYTIDEKGIETLVSEIVDEKLENASKFNQTAKYKILVQRLKRVITISLKYIVNTLKNSSFRVAGTEVKFDNTEDSKYPPIEIKLDNGKTVSIIGKIDRIDVAKMPDGKYIRIIDYKSSTKDIDLNKFVAGLQLQLITYVDAVCKNEKVSPAGAFYFSLLEPKIAQRNVSKEEIEEILKQNYRMNGIVVANIDVIKAMDNNLEDGKSAIVPVTIKGDKINERYSSSVTKEEFESLQKYSVKLIKQISKEILSGNIALKPYYNVAGKTTPCKYCPYKSVCQFDQKLKNNYYRVIPKDTKENILKKIEES